MLKRQEVILHCVRNDNTHVGKKGGRKWPPSGHFLPLIIFCNALSFRKNAVNEESHLRLFLPLNALLFVRILGKMLTSCQTLLGRLIDWNGKRNIDSPAIYSRDGRLNWFSIVPTFSSGIEWRTGFSVFRPKWNWWLGLKPLNSFWAFVPGHKWPG